MKLHHSPVPEDDFEVLLASFKPRARAITATFGIAPEDGEDLLQEALLTYLHKRDEVHSPEAWLAATLRKRCLMFWRSRRRSVLRQVDTTILELFADGQTSGQETADLRSDLNRTLRKLPDHCRSLLVLRYRTGLSPTEAAKSMGYRSSGIYKVLERCLSAFCHRLTLAGGSGR